MVQERPPLTERELIERIQMMRPGQHTVYFTGNIAAEAFWRRDVARLRDAAQRLSNMRALMPNGETFVGMGLVTLVQRVVDGRTNYLAIKLK